MNLLDVNVLVFAFREDADRHEEYQTWLDDLINGDSVFGLSEQALTGFVRISTHPKIFKKPSTLEEAFGFARALRTHPHSRLVRPTESHWSLFTELCRAADARGNLVTDAWFAALAIESGCTWITTDRDFAYFPGLCWQHPLNHERAIVNPAR